MDRNWDTLIEKLSSEIGIEESRGENLKQFAVASTLNDLSLLYGDRNTRLQQELQENFRLNNRLKTFETLVENSPVGYLVLDVQGRVLDSNSFCARIFGLPVNKLVGLGILGLVDTRYANLLMQTLRFALESSERQSCEVRFSKIGGSAFWAKVEISRLQMDSPEETKLLCSILDETSSRIVDQMARKLSIGLAGTVGSSFFFRLTNLLVEYPGIEMAIVSYVPHLDKPQHFETLAINHNGNLQTGFEYQLPEPDESSPLQEPNNRNAEYLLRKFKMAHSLSAFFLDSTNRINGQIVVLSREEFPNPRLYSSILRIVNARVSAEIDRTRTEQAMIQYRDRLEKQVSSRATQLEEKNHHLAREVAKRVETEKSLRLAKSAAEEATRAKSDFLANMSHEIRTPMNGIFSMLSMLERSVLEPDQKEYVKIIQESGRTLLELLNDIIDISKLESGNLHLDEKEFDLHKMCRDVFSTYADRFSDRRIDFLFDSPDIQQLIVRSDAVRIRQVIENLLSNSLKFTNTGFVRLSLRRSKHEDRSLIRITVSDTGIGLSEDDLAHIGSRFWQADPSSKRRHGGTGLGLAICRFVAERLEGRLHVHSRQDVGSRFTLEFPASVVRYQSRTTSELGKRVRLLHPNPRVLRTWKQEARAESFTPRDTPDVDCVILDESLRRLPATKRMLKGFEGRILVSCFRIPKAAEKDPRIEFVPKPLMNALNLLRTGPRQTPRSLEPERRRERVAKDLRVLVAEDNAIARQVMSFMLENIGIETDLAEDGEDAILRVDQKKYDLVFMDLRMPRKDGFEALKEIRHRSSRRFPVVALTANAMKGDRENCISAGFDDYVAKPVTVDGILSVLRRRGISLQ